MIMYSHGILPVAVHHKGGLTMAPYSRGSRVLIAVSLVGVLGLAAWQGRMVWEDSGSFVFLLFGIPAVCAALALWVECANRTMLAPAIVAVLAVVSLVWSLITGLGVGWGLLVPSLLLLVAAMISGVDRRPVRSAPARN
ncbi:hypothetical protein O2W15_11315 [Modestobacter sp. VKM Ac-2979]|uniref:hypothetical protein n=1 Tax=unclassified Modestobacter TaxID=2643866 RepID=UPI0022AB8C76|nr:MULTISPECIES: hypothetical protein [unclassified Modestobacter]MCZ2812022.1 hypothetical protein [Modestobacter sp. VKM Ac-2979]MCZ2843746.1 hypothetical protein [Modestobacter sp. VKM Ac-2980]